MIRTAWDGYVITVAIWRSPTVEENPETINKLSDELTLLRQKLAQMESLLAEYKKTEKELPQQNKNNRLTSESSIAHQQIEQALRESEEKYRVLFDNEIYAISIFDLETLKILDVNDNIHATVRL
jgi:PAS domain-containing protein